MTAPNGTLLFSGTDLASLCIVEDLSDFWSSSDVRGDLATYPGSSGSVAVQRPVSSKIRSGQVTVTGATHSATEDAVAALKAVLKFNQSQTVTRRKYTGSGNLDTTQTAIVRTAEERWIGDSACTLLIAVEATDGLWYGSSTTIASAAGTQSISGEASTRKMTITLDAGSARTVMNNTNGYYVQFLTTVPSGGVLIDVAKRTATAITGGADMSQYMQWGKSAPMQLDPGSNVFSIDSGSASISYQPTYL